MSFIRSGSRSGGKTGQVPSDQADTAAAGGRGRILRRAHKAGTSSGQAQSDPRPSPPARLAPFTAFHLPVEFKPVEARDIFAYIERDDPILTAAGAELDAQDIRPNIVYTASGALFVSKDHTRHHKVQDFISRLQARGHKIRIAFSTSMDGISEIYGRSGSGSAQRRHGGNISDRQQQFLDMVKDAAEIGASDIHVTCYGDHAQVQHRLDGMLYRKFDMDIKVAREVLSATFNLAANTDVAYSEQEFQSARISADEVPLADNVQVIRCQFNPAMSGRAAVFRLLYRQRSELSDIDALGYNRRQMEAIAAMKNRPYGMTLVAGPTGSGKSTTCALMISSRMREADFTIKGISIEDPPEYTLPGVVQYAVSEGNSAAAMKAALRSDPDCLFLGEIRDREMGRLCFEGANTGHNMTSTIHANDMISIPGRLKDVGIEPYKTYDPDLLTGLVSQRLLRKTCPHCGMSLEDGRGFILNKGTPNERPLVSDADMRRFEAALGNISGKLRIAHPEGCDECNNFGYKGRSVVSEVNIPDYKFMKFLREGHNEKAMIYWINEIDGQSMMDHSFEKIVTGDFSPFEAERVLGPLMSREERLQRYSAD